MSRYTRILSSGSGLPQRIVTNNELALELAERQIETSDEWIFTRTGIRQRHIVSGDEGTTFLAEKAARAALAAAGVAADSVDLIIVATSTPDQVFPSTACLVQAKLGAAGGAAFDVQAACSGFVYALTLADSLIRSGAHQRALVIGAETFTRLLDWSDRTTCVLFGDGAGAVLLEASDSPGILAGRIHADGSKGDILTVNGHLDRGLVSGIPFVHMDGKAVFKVAVDLLGKSAHEVLELAGLTADDVDWFVPHQANIRILSACAKHLNLPMSKVVVAVEQHGNTSAASVPLALDKIWREGGVSSGQHILMQGVGGGFTWGSVLARI